jgi:hypothetical protein
MFSMSYWDIRISHKSILGVPNAAGKSPMADNDNPDGNRRGALIGLAAVVVLFVVGWLLARELYASGRMEDCLMSGRTNCAPIETSPR